MEAKAIFPANLKELPHILLWFRGHLSQLHCDSFSLHKLELALEEAVVNIIQHSRSDEIAITLKGEAKQQIEITLSDEGPPFNPLEEAPPVDRSSSLEERKEGGLGIFLIKQIIDELDYRREGNCNILILKKKIY